MVIEARAVPRWKRVVARFVSWPPVGLALRAGIRLAAPHHRVGAVVVIFDEGHRVLLVEHLFHPGDPWGLPGGWVGRSESPQSAARRELLEETRLDVEIGPVVRLERKYFPTPVCGHVGHNQSDHLSAGTTVEL